MWSSGCDSQRWKSSFQRLVTSTPDRKKSAFHHIGCLWESCGFTWRHRQPRVQSKGQKAQRTSLSSLRYVCWGNRGFCVNAYHTLIILWTSIAISVIFENLSSIYLSVPGSSTLKIGNFTKIYEVMNFFTRIFPSIIIAKSWKLWEFLRFNFCT